MIGKNCRKRAREMKNFLHQKSVEMIENLTKEIEINGTDDRPINPRGNCNVKLQADKSPDRLL